MSKTPVFILGSTRSGTSVMSRLLRTVLGYSGDDEGHLWTIYSAFIDILDQHDEWIKKDFPPIAVTSYQRLGFDRMSRDLDDLFLNYADELFPNGSWVDKTPAHKMSQLVPRLQRLFPQARFIMMRRRGIENLMSARRKFPDRPFENLCYLWNEAMVGLHGLRRHLHYVLEIDHQELVLEPHSTCEKLGEFLGSPEDRTVACVDFLIHNHPEQTAEPLKDYIDLADTGWTKEERSQFVSICEEAMNLWGYAMGVDNLHLISRGERKDR